MLIARALTDGRILGYAVDLETVTALAQANDWPSWYAQEHEPPNFTILPPEPDTDPRNKRGLHL